MNATTNKLLGGKITKDIYHFPKSFSLILVNDFVVYRLDIYFLKDIIYR